MSDTKKVEIVIIDDSYENIHIIAEILSKENYTIRPYVDQKEALQAIEERHPDMVLLDIDMPGMNGFEVCRTILSMEGLESIPIIFISVLSDVENRIQGFREGGVDYLSRPFYREEISARIKNHLELQRQRKALEEENQIRKRLESELREINESLEMRVREKTQKLSRSLTELKRLKRQLEADNSYLREEIDQVQLADGMLGESDAFMKTLSLIEQVASTDSTVMILGETGTGKELVARTIHSKSARRSRPLVKVCCASLPPSLIESELFGHEKGAFSGAVTSRKGRFELANNGTLFLDEIGELPLNLQTKLLRVLQDGEYEKVGGSKTLKVNIRFIAATHRDLEARVAEGKFREDLWFRLNVFPIIVPSLQERLDDIPLLAEHFIKKHGQRVGKNIRRISRTVISQLRSYSWPGNIRELENVIERAIIMAKSDELSSIEVGTARKAPRKGGVALSKIEKNHIEQVLGSVGWKIDGRNGAAEKLELNPSTLRFRMKKLGIKRPTERD